jgi:putative glycosyltransferase (TIGR04372 family)
MVLPDHSLDVGLSHFKIRLDHPQDRAEAKLYEAGGPRSPSWIISQRMLTHANMEWYRRRALSPDFCPWRTIPPLSPELAAFVGADQGPIALIHARTGHRSGADNAGVGPAVADLYPTIDYLRTSGFRVVKFGMEPTPQEWRDLGVIDYSGSSLRSFYNDICLIGAGAIALYNGTGMSALHDVIGTPMVSYGHWHLPWLPQTPRGVVVPTLLRSRATYRLLRFSEQIAIYRQSSELWESGNVINFPAAYEAVTPTGEDIRAGVEEALTLAGSAIPLRSALQEKFHALEANGYYKYCRSRIGQDFLERNRIGLEEGF